MLQPVIKSSFVEQAQIGVLGDDDDDNDVDDDDDDDDVDDGGDKNGGDKKRQYLVGNEFENEREREREREREGEREREIERNKLSQFRVPTIFACVRYFKSKTTSFEKR